MNNQLKILLCREFTLKTYYCNPIDTRITKVPLILRVFL